jgi:hypothetical protein
MNSEMKLYVWHDSLTDYTEGVMFAYASSTAEARKLILQDCSYVPKEQLNEDPSIYETPVGFAVWGGS